MAKKPPAQNESPKTPKPLNPRKKPPAAKTPASATKKRQPKAKQESKTVKHPKSATPPKTASVYQSNENWTVVTCPECGTTNPQSFELVNKIKSRRYLKCKECGFNWSINLEGVKRRGARTQTANAEALYEQTAREARQKQADQKNQKKQAEPPKTGRQPFVTRPTPDEEQMIHDRRNLVWELHIKAKFSVRQIADHLKNKGFETASVGTVQNDIDYMRTLRHEGQVTMVNEIILDELDVINDVHQTWYPVFKRPFFGGGLFRDEAKKDATDVILQCSDRRVRLLVPNKHILELNDPDKLLAQLTGVPVDQLPDVAGGDDDDDDPDDNEA